MGIPETEKLVETFAYEYKVAFIAFCAERCFKEAQLHKRANEQLNNLPLLAEGLQILWKRAENPGAIDIDRVKLILKHTSTDYELPGADMQHVIYNADIVLVEGARAIMKGMKVLLDPAKATPRYVAGTSSASFISAARVYTEYDKSRNNELAICEIALLRLRDFGNKPFSRLVFEDIPDWERGAISGRYAEGRIKNSAQ